MRQTQRCVTRCGTLTVAPVRYSLDHHEDSPMREQPDIAEQDLRACLRDQYGLAAASIEFLPLGHDTRSAVYRVMDDTGTPYLLKATSAPLYEPGCLVPRYLRDSGVAAVVAPLPTQRGKLWTSLEIAGSAETWTAILYPFITGESGWLPRMTDAQWQALGATLRQIHTTELPPAGFALLRTETFDPGGYRRWVEVFETRHIATASPESDNQNQRALRSSWIAHQATISEATTALETLAGVLWGRSGKLVICHADLHPGNLIRDAAGQVFVVDWNDVMLAPKERDFLFIEGAPVDAAGRQASSPFFQGYGAAEIDWAALTYYLWERVIQDVIECAQIVFLREHVGELTQAAEAQLCQDILADGDTLDAARAVLSRLRLG